MSRPCRVCKGSRFVGKYHCRACGGTGDDPNWREKPCAAPDCHRTLEYNVHWSHIPDYCEYCKQTQYKNCPACGGTITYKVYWSHIPKYCSCKGWSTKSCANPTCPNQRRYHYEWTRVPDYCDTCRRDHYKPCTNPHCTGSIRYKPYWDRIPDYCTCKGWYQESCGNTHCNGQIDIHCTWTHPPKYCKSCKGWYETRCITPGCNTHYRIHSDWTQPPERCDQCRKMERRRGEDLCRGNELEQYLPEKRGINVGESKLGNDYLHVTLYVDGGHVSAEVHKYSTAIAGFHRTLETYDEHGKRTGKESW